MTETYEGRVTPPRPPAEAAAGLRAQGNPLGIKSKLRKPSAVRVVQEQDCRPTPERRAKTQEGFETERATDDTKSRFSRIRPIFTLSATVAEAISAFAKKFDMAQPDARDAVASLNGNGTLDKSLTEHPHLRDALAKYVEDTAKVESCARIQSYGERVLPVWKPHEVSDAQSRMGHLRGALPREHRKYLDWLATTMLNLHDGDVPTAHEVGAQITRLESKEAGRHAFTGYSLAVAEGLHHAYREWGRARAAQSLVVVEQTTVVVTNV